MSDDKRDDRPVNKLYDGPCRETAHGILTREIAALRRKADGLEALLKGLGGDGQFPTGSPAEEALWEILQSRRNPNY